MASNSSVTPDGRSAGYSRDILPQGKWRLAIGALAVAAVLAVVAFAVVRAAGGAANNGQLTEDRMIILRNEITRLQVEMTKSVAVDRKDPYGAGVVLNPIEAAARPSDDDIKRPARNTVELVSLRARAADGNARSWRDGLRRIRGIYERRLDWMEKCESARTQLAEAQAAFALADDNLLAVSAKLAVNQQREVALVRSENEIRPATVTVRDPLVRAEYDDMLSRIAVAYVTCREHFTFLKEREYAAIAVYLQHRDAISAAESTIIVATAWLEQLRSDSLAATETYEQQVRGDYPAAVTVCDEWIGLEADNPLPYLARGIAHRTTGSETLADADFGRATQLDPNLAGLMIVEIRQAMKSK